VDLNGLVKALSDHPGFSVAALALTALAYVFKLYVASITDHLQTVKEVTPIAQKLAEGAEALERMMLETRKG
jgi:hypothetical protein